jgi:cell division protein FtsN
MAQGTGRTGQPNIGQRSIFGGGNTIFTQMPSYTPVSRGEPRQQAPEPTLPSYNPYTANLQPAPIKPSLPQQAAPSHSGFEPTPSYQSSSYQPQSFGTSQQSAAPQTYPSTDPQPQQAYPASGYIHIGSSSQSYQSPAFSDSSFADTSFADASFPEPTSYSKPAFAEPNYSQPSFAEPNPAEPRFPETSFADQHFGNTGFSSQSFGDASVPESNFDASFPDSTFPASSAFNQPESLSHDASDGFGAQSEPEHSFEGFPEETTQDYGMSSQPAQQGSQSDPRRQLQAFDALYDQPPTIALGSTQPRKPSAPDFYEAERADADFLDESQVAPPPGARSKFGMTLKGRSAFMVGSALLGAIALGGALAFAYKQSGGGMSGEEPPLVTADARPVKELPDQPGGKEFPHKNKLIYDRLSTGDEPEGERIVPRQEDVAVPALPGSAETAGLPTPVATTDLVTPQMADAVGDPSAEQTGPDGGPRKVKTLVVRPDGSVAPSEPESTAAVADGSAAAPAQSEDTAAEAAPAAPAEAPAAAAATPLPAAAAPAAPAPAQQQTAALAPQAAAPAAEEPQPAASAKYVVQVGSKKNQTEALATFADIQQKYPSLLGNYRPIVQKASLGSKGTWYRLRIGPIDDKTAAYKLCTQLKSQGLPDCLVMTQ